MWGNRVRRWLPVGDRSGWSWLGQLRSKGAGGHQDGVGAPRAHSRNPGPRGMGLVEVEWVIFFFPLSASETQSQEGKCSRSFYYLALPASLWIPKGSASSTCTPQVQTLMDDLGCTSLPWGWGCPGVVWPSAPHPGPLFLAAETCTMTPQERVNCGFPGVTESECKSKGCCFNSDITGFPWCFYPVAVDNPVEGRDVWPCVGTGWLPVGQLCGFQAELGFGEPLGQRWVACFLGPSCL